MDRKKVSILGLVIIGVLFGVGQGGGFFRNDDSAKEPDQERQREISREQSGWTDPIKRGLGWLGLIDAIEVSRFSKWRRASSGGAKCRGKISDGQLIVTLDAECELSATIAPASDEQELKLEVIEGCAQAREFARLDRISLQHVAKPQVESGRITAALGGKAGGENSNKEWLSLAVTYKPKDERAVTMGQPWTCGKEPVTLIILPAGGDLTLKCDRCRSGKVLKLRIG